MSTALMYAFRQRSDTRVIDEPLYAHYLRHSGRDHPGREAVLAAQSDDGNAVMAELVRAAGQSPHHLFTKHMAHHLLDIDRAPLASARHLFLVRDPREMLSSLTIQLPDAALADTGLEVQCRLFDALCETGATPVVIESRALLSDPDGVLGKACAQLGLDWQPAMLSWPAGPKPEDGVWAPHWYAAVHASTGFSEYRPKPPLPASLEPLAAVCQPYFERLRAHAITIGKSAHEPEI